MLEDATSMYRRRELCAPAVWGLRTVRVFDFVELHAGRLVCWYLNIKLTLSIFASKKSILAMKSSSFLGVSPAIAKIFSLRLSTY